jgi:hypothetical protein
MLVIIKKNNRHYLMCFVKSGCIHASQTNLEVEHKTGKGGGAHVKNIQDPTVCHCQQPFTVEIQSSNPSLSEGSDGISSISYVKGGAVISGDR